MSRDAFRAGVGALWLAMAGNVLASPRFAEAPQDGAGSAQLQVKTVSKRVPSKPVVGKASVKSKKAMEAAVKAVPDTADDARWWTFQRDDILSLAVDRESIVRNGDAVTAWVRIRYAKPQKLEFNGKPFVQYVAHMTYFCGSRQSSHDELILHDAAGSVVARVQFKPWEIEKQSIAPDTVDEYQYKAACNP